MAIARRFRIMLTVVTLAAVTALAFTVWSNLRILHDHRDRLYDSTTAIPPREIGIVLGTSPSLGDGSPNPFFTYRIDAAVALFRAGKVRHLIVSGSNPDPSYNEPAAMRAALVRRGIPDSAITSDFAGLRTLDTVIRARDVFAAGPCTFITQRAHAARALEIASARGIDAIGFCARDVDSAASLRFRLREIIARDVAIIDLYLIHRQPRFPGPREPIAHN